MIRGMSFQKGIIFLGKNYVSCTYNEKGKQKSWVKPINPSSLLTVTKLLLFSMPTWFYIFFSVWLLLILVPLSINDVNLDGWPNLPVFTIIYFFFGTHFWFPSELKKYHGAEHKVFNYKGVVSIRNKREINNKKIINRYCSTNTIVVYFLSVFLLTAVLIIFSSYPWLKSLEIATFLSVILLPIFMYWLNRKRLTKLHHILLALSYWLQRNVTTSEPEDKHLRIAIHSYRQLARKEFPEKLKIQKRKEKKPMAIADITVVPIGSATTSVSAVVSEIHRILKETKKDIKFQLTPMSTLIEGELSVVFEVIQEIHEVPFKLGEKRVTTNIRIDDRRDKLSTMEGKVSSVESKLKEANKANREVGDN